ncbi:hypothetical protein L6164_016711 [Bauhinia variegata]|uniref:Uncharacterized protein n=1 Tax=Bauhinia variegata TaxID=167791 RepID=A0ACB9N5D6_BAUVA|nr:hypothetical protein L6164_016711 [Bauhinia variegata]
MLEAALRFQVAFEKLEDDDRSYVEHFGELGPPSASDWLNANVLNHLLYLMRVLEKAVQRQVALALAHLCSADDQKTIFIDSDGLELLIGLLGSSSPKQQLDGAVALWKLASKAMTLSP